jgi:hypothetical protein
MASRMPAAVRRAIEPPVGCLADLAVLGDRLGLLRVPEGS